MNIVGEDKVHTINSILLKKIPLSTFTSSKIDTRLSSLASVDTHSEFESNNAQPIRLYSLLHLRR